METDLAIKKCIEEGVFSETDRKVRDYYMRKQFRDMVKGGVEPGKAIEHLAKMNYLSYSRTSNIVYNSAKKD